MTNVTHPAEQPRGNGSGGAPIVCGHDSCPGIPPLTEERVRTSPLTVGALAMVLGALLALGAGVLAVSAHLRDARAAVVRVHDQAAASHPDIRASQERSTKRIEGRLDAVTHALDRIREDLRQRAAEPARRRRR